MESVKHGHWTWNEADECWICDNCGSAALNNYRGSSSDSRYCPHCGLEMYEAEVQTNEV